MLAQKVQFQLFPKAEHLTSSYFKHIHQDQNGFIWVMGNRADRFDGYNFVPANGQNNGLPSFFSEEKYEMSSKAVIFKTEDHFLIQTLHNWQTDTIPFREVLPEHAHFTKTFVHELADGQLLFPYVDTLTNFLNFLRLEKDNKLVRHFDKPAFVEGQDFNMFFIMSDDKGRFYTFENFSRHILQYDSKGILMQRIPIYNEDLGFTEMALIEGNKLLFLKNDSIYIWNATEHLLQTHPLTEFTSDFGQINGFEEDRDGDFWLCGSDRNLLFYDKVEKKAYDFTEELTKLIPWRVQFKEMIIDRSGVIWIMTYLGVIKVVPKDDLFDSYFSDKDELCNGYCSFRGITEGDEEEIYASFYSGIMKIDRKRKTTEQLFPDRGFSPRGLSWKDGKLIFNNGSFFDPKTNLTDDNPKPTRNYIMDLGQVVTDGKGSYWNAQEDTVYFLSHNNVSTKWIPLFSLPNHKGRNVLYYGPESEKIWMADGNRLFSYQLGNSTFKLSTTFSNQESIRAIHEDDKGLLWLGMDSGLVKYDPTAEKEIKRFTTNEGLSDNIVTGVLTEGDSCLWLSTYFGLSRFHMKKEQFLNFYEQDGLSENKFNLHSAYKAKDGQLFFGGYRGVNAFYPEEVMEDYNHKKNHGQLVLSSFTRTDEKEQSILVDRQNLNQKSLECYHWNKAITFEFTLNDYKTTPQNKYSYFLEGFEDDWSSPAKYNFAKYPTLPAGSYTFRVKVLEANGYWNPNELRVPVIVYPPWWQTNLAYSLYIAGLIGLVFLCYRLLRYRWNLKTKYRMEQDEARRLKELNTFKSRLFTNLTHEFRTPLTVILGMAEELLNGFKELRKGQREIFENQTTMIQRNGKSLLQLVNQLLDLSKLQHKAYKVHSQNDNIIPVLNYLTSSFQSYANQKDIALSFRSTLMELEMDFDPDLLQQLMTNLLSNAIKFTPSGGQVTLRVNRVRQEGDDLITIKIEDTGVGIPDSKVEHIFDLFYQADDSTTRAGEGTGIGLAHSKEIVELVNGRISVESKLGKGTVFTIQLPIKNEAEKVTKTKRDIISKMPLENRPIVHNGIAALEMKKEEYNKDLPIILLIEDNSDVLTYLLT